jgi:type I restriction enzyme, S subunit
VIGERVRLGWVAPLRRKSPAVPIEGPIAFLPMGAIGDDGSFDRTSIRDAAEVIDSGYTYFENGDVVRARVTPCFENGKGALLSRLEGARGLGTTELFVFRPTPAINARYLYYVTQSNEFTELGTATMYGAHGVRRVDSDFVKEYRVWLAPVREQEVIADYLDAETARIDALIAKKRRMIDLLGLRLHETISSVTALGEPVRVRHVTSLRTSGPRGWANLVGERGQPFVRSANLRRDDIELRTDNLATVEPPGSVEAKRSRTRPGDVLIGITGANTGWVGLVRPPLSGAFVSQHVAILRPENVLPEWLAYSLFSRRSQEALLASQYGGTKQQLGLDDLGELWINRPSAQDQATAVTQLDVAKRTAKAATEALTRQLTLIQEHRQALVTAAVTGEFDLPGVAT